MAGTLEVFLAPFSLLFLIILLSPTCVSKEDDCIHLTTCGYHIPPPPEFYDNSLYYSHPPPPPPPNPLPIQFPFRLKNQQQKNCSYPGYGLSCTKKNETVLELPFSGKFFVNNINYTARQMEIYDPDNCIPRRLIDLNLSHSPFKLPEYYPQIIDFHNKYFIFNCSKDFTVSSFQIINCLNKPNSTYNIGGILEYTGFGEVDLVDLQGKCNRMMRTTIPLSTNRDDAIVANATIVLTWDKSARCRKCESHGGQCTFNSNYTSLDDIGCFGAKGFWQRNTEIGLSIGFFVFVVATLLIIRKCTQIDKDEKEKQLKIEKFLESYKDLTPTRYLYADIKRMTNKFQRQLGEGGYGSVYEGKLTNGIPVAVKILNDSQSNGEDFLNEVGTIGRIHHINVVRLLGFCADGFRRALIYEFMSNESLEKFIFSAGKDNNPFFGWEKLQSISMGIARGIEYLHQGCEQRILHFDIKPHNILLDHKFNPKISDFGLAKLCSKVDSMVSMTAARGTMGYIAPEVFSRNFGKVSYKSDVYSFGMLLLEMVGGRKNIELKVDKPSQVYFPEWIYSRLEQGEELGIEVETEEDAKIAKTLATAALWCIQWNPVDRPSMKSVIQMLEGNSENLIMPPNPFASLASATTSTTIPGKPQQQIELTVIQEEPE